MKIVDELFKVIDEKASKNKEQMILTLICDSVRYYNIIDLNLIKIQGDNLICYGEFGEIWVRLNVFSNLIMNDDVYEFKGDINSYMKISFI